MFEFAKRYKISLLSDFLEALNQVYEVKDYDITDDACQNSPFALHFFKPNTQTLFIVDVSKVSGNLVDKVSFDKVNLLIDFKIPYDHASICLPNGSIYLTGGSDYQKHFKDCFEFSLISKKM
jgi:hypothetical protein